jgi:predicted RNA binding protein YcfA (HicA-like mRNA interferase family)
MNGKEFIKRVKRLARDRSIPFEETRQGKGSHSRVYYGRNLTTVKQGEIGPGLLNEMCKQLGITKKDLMEN